MLLGMKKKVLTEQSIYFGEVSMPKHFEIDQIDLAHHILHSTFNNTKSLHSRTLDKLSSYIRDFTKLKHDINLIDYETWGDIYKPQQVSTPLLNVDPVDLRNSPDYTLLYGVQVDNCSVRIHYDDNRRKGRSWDMELKKNMFIMFPSTNMYYITNNQKNSLNFIQTITYEFI
jgi:hypothetical protein|tara:strand:- start:358 stop:873 length:516 start_codon:yes stop_codon:yes gene_type:complete